MMCASSCKRPVKPHSHPVFDALTTLGIRIVGAGLAFALQALLARLMNTQDYGHFVMVWTWILSLGSFASLGLAEVALRVLPRYALRMRQRAIRGFFNHGFRTTAAAACMFSLQAVLVVQFLPLSETTRAIVYGVCLGLPLLALEFFLEGVARAMGWFRLTTVTVYIVRPVMIGLVCLGLWTAGFALTGTVVCLVLAGCLTLTTLLLRFVMHDRLSQRGAAATPSSTMRKFWMRQSGPMLVASGLDDALNYLDVVLLGLLLSPLQAAGYFVASRVLTLANLAQYAFYFVATRTFSAALAEGDPKLASRKMWKATALTTATTFLAVIATLIMAPLLLAVFGKTYTDGFWLVVILGLAQIARAFAGQAMELMLVDGRTRQLSWINGCAVAVLALSFVLIVPHFGVMAAGWIMVAVMAARSLAVLALQFTAGSVLPAETGAASRLSGT
jgi:O-antigen/teichoic acid export membrane protein